jgi:hypothetical protein
MDIKALLTKVLKGDALTDEDKQALTEYDPDRSANSAAAAARKKAEGELKAARDRAAELEAQLAEAGSEGKTELEKLQKQVEKLSKTITDKDALLQKAEADRKKGLRDGKIGKLMSGIKLMDGVDADLVRMGLERSLSEIGDDDLDNDDATKPVLAGFMTKNKALIVGDAGGGGGTPPKDGASGASGSGDPMKMTAAERQVELKKKGII